MAEILYLNESLSSIRRSITNDLSRHKERDERYDVLNYIKNPTYIDYYDKYTRQDIAKRVVDTYPDATWSHPPIISDEEESNDPTDYQKNFDKFAKRVQLYYEMNKLDKLATLGTYAVMLIGVKDGRSLEQPMGKLNSLDDVVYLTPMTEETAVIDTYDSDPSSYRYGHPLTYKVKLNDYRYNTMPHNVKEMHQNERIVHYTRMLHVAEGVIDNNVFGEPKLKKNYNRLDDLEKILGGSAEIFWLNGRGGLSINAHKDTEIHDSKKLEEHTEDYAKKLTRILRTKGMDVKTLDFQVHSPEKHVEAQIDMICASENIPKRILMGSERGHLSSSQDEKNWVARVVERRENFCTPRMINPFMDILIMSGALPDVDYYVEWHELSHISEQDKADIAVKMSQAIFTYANGLNSEMYVPPEQFVEEVLGLTFQADDTLDPMDYIKFKDANKFDNKLKSKDGEQDSEEDNKDDEE